MYYTYILRCADNSLYTGITTDIERRISEHTSGSKKAAKYTLTHSVISLEAAWISESRSTASKLEYHLKTLTKAEKEDLIKDGSLERFFSEKIDVSGYMLYKKD